MDYAPIREVPFTARDGQPVWGRNWSMWHNKLTKTVSELEDAVKRVFPSTLEEQEYSEYCVTLAEAATIQSDARLVDTIPRRIFRVTLTADRILGNPTNAKCMQPIAWQIKQDGTGGHVLAFGNKFRFGADITSAVLSTGANKNDYLGVLYDAHDDKFDVVSFVKGY